MKDGNAVIAEFITGVNWDQLPTAAQDVARLALLDTLGAMLAGTLTPVSNITAQFAATTWPGDEATILLDGRRVSASGAAFANGYAANGLDIDDCGFYTKGHPGALIFPTALALTEAGGMSGADLLTGMVVGYEVACRAGRIWHATHDFYQACGSWGAVTCAAIAAHLRGFSIEQTQHALGIADYHAPNLPMMRDIDHPAMVKHGIGWGAMTGILAADLAAHGFTGIPSLFGLDEYQDWVTDVGQHYIVEDGMAWKRYACCAWDHAAILGAEQLMQEHGFTAEEIAHIRVESFHETARLGVELPATTEEAQFNLAWPLAAYIIDGELGPDQILAHAFERPDIRNLVERIEVTDTEELNELYRLACLGDPLGKYFSRVVIELIDGRVLDSGSVEGEINFPQETWDQEGLEEKFRWLAGYVLDGGCVDELVEMLRYFEDVPNVRELVEVVGV